MEYKILQPLSYVVHGFRSNFFHASLDVSFGFVETHLLVHEDPCNEAKFSF